MMRYFVDNNSPGVIYQVKAKFFRKAKETLLLEGGNPTEISYSNAISRINDSRFGEKWELRNVPKWWIQDSDSLESIF